MEKTDTQGILELLSVAGLEGRHDDQDHPGHAQCEEHEEPDNDQGEDPGDEGVDGEGDLKIQGLLPLFIHIGGLVLLDEPDDQWTEYVAERDAWLNPDLTSA